MLISQLFLACLYLQWLGILLSSLPMCLWGCGLHIPLWGALTMDQTISVVRHNSTSHLHVRPPDLENSLKK